MKKLHYKDVPVIKGTDKREYFKVEGGQWSLDESYIRRQACTHMDCKECGKEFEKNYRGLCTECYSKKNSEDYKKLPLVEWDGTTPLSLFNDPETYFFDPESVAEYLEEQDIPVEELMLVTCYQTTFSEVNVRELNGENLHNNFEPDNELVELEEALNKYLRTASTHTWLPTDERVSIDKSDIYQS